MTGYLAVGFEFAAELTYPEPEVTSSGLLNASAQVFGIVLTLLARTLLDAYGDVIVNSVLSAALLVGAFLILFIKPELKRLQANLATSANLSDLTA